MEQVYILLIAGAPLSLGLTHGVGIHIMDGQAFGDIIMDGVEMDITLETTTLLIMVMDGVIMDTLDLITGTITGIGMVITMATMHQIITITVMIIIAITTATEMVLLRVLEMGKQKLTPLETIMK
jgi:hypothetical protein